MKKLLNDGWEFLKLSPGSSLETATQSNGWKPVDIPHDWLIWQHQNLYESADVWYRRDLEYIVPPETCILSFDGVYMDCDVLLNGKIICSHAYGYTAFFVDLTKDIRKGKNEIHVHIRHRSPNSRWYSGSGIFRDVHLFELPSDHLVPDSFYIFTEQKKDGWSVDLSAETDGTDRVLFSCALFDPNGRKLTENKTLSQNGKIQLTLNFPDSEKWDVDHPALHTLKYTYGKEEGEKKIGLRTTEFTSDRGFFLNGRSIKLKGVCLHHDLGALGAAFHEKAAKRQLILMKEMGANALRTSHNPPASSLLDLCDELGILVVDEAFDMWERPKTQFDYARFFPLYEKEDVALWIRRDRCHPCVIMWSIGNEIYDMHADLRWAEVCTMLMNQVRFHDPKGHAAVTFGCNYMPWEGGQRCADIVKIAGYNYGEKYYASHHSMHPDWVIYGSETASVLSSRGIYHFPIEKSIMSEQDLQCSALGNSNTSWGAEDLKKIIVEDLACTYSMGQFIWSGIDYIGEPTPYHTRNSYFGQADTACFPKDSYFLFQSLWSKKPVLHIGVTWDWNPGQLIDVPVMTNYRRIELLVNGCSYGIRNVDPTRSDACLPVWKIPFESGVLCARALDDMGNILKEDFRFTNGDTAGLVLLSENESLLSDGHDIAFITVQAVDINGKPVENARDRIDVHVSGGAYLAGTDNGDSSDTDGYKQNSRRLFGGKMLLIIASNGLKEDAVIQIRSTGGNFNSLTLSVKDTDLVSGTSCVQRIEERIGTNSEIPVRKIEIIACEDTILSKENPSCLFQWKKLPEDASDVSVAWQITNEAGIETPFVEFEAKGNIIRVTAKGDGHFYLRGLTGNAKDHPEIISQIEFSAEGIGNPSINPYEFVCAGLYDISEGNIGSGNEKGIAFSRDGESMVGYSRVDFGKNGSDKLILPVFALDGKSYQILMFDGDPRKDGKLISSLQYEKPSIWNQYQEEIYTLPIVLKGVHTICFRMKEKVHLKGFRFEEKDRAFSRHTAGEADSIYGDSFLREGDQIKEIGNNVTLTFDDMDFCDIHECGLMIRGKTDLKTNAITVHIRSENGKSEIGVADFKGDGAAEQLFRIRLPGRKCTVSFVFLPGSHFDFESFIFVRD